jgi:signal transduction histidine kinase
MSPEKLIEIQSQSGGVGLRGMRERLRRLHGELKIESDSSGTKFSAYLPVPEVQSSSEQAAVAQAPGAG